MFSTKKHDMLYKKNTILRAVKLASPWVWLAVDETKTDEVEEELQLYKTWIQVS